MIVAVDFIFPILSLSVGMRWDPINIFRLSQNLLSWWENMRTNRIRNRGVSGRGCHKNVILATASLSISIELKIKNQEDRKGDRQIRHNFAIADLVRNGFRDSLDIVRT